MWQSLKRCCAVLAILALAEFLQGAKGQITKQKLPSHNSSICQTQPNGALLPNPSDCRKFYLCLQQQPFEYNCNPGYFYNATTRHCVQGVPCASAFNTTAACREGNIRAVPDHCNAFEACISGEYQKLNCLPNYYFNAQKSICLPFKYDAEFKCNCLMPEYTVLENENDCETYYVCHKRSAVMEKCPLGQYFKAQLNTCVIDLAGDCLMKPTIASVHADYNKYNIENKCRNLGLYNINFQTFPKGCNTFYTCVNGQLLTQHCPKSFYYDGSAKRCIFDATRKCLAGYDQQK